MRTYLKSSVYTLYCRAWIVPAMISNRYHVYELGEADPTDMTYAGVIEASELAPYFEGFHS